VVGKDFEMDRQIERADLDGCLADASGWYQRASAVLLERADLDGCLAGASGWYQRAGAVLPGVFLYRDRIEAASTRKGRILFSFGDRDGWRADHWTTVRNPFTTAMHEYDKL
jgi:hypothetical protein